MPWPTWAGGALQQRRLTALIRPFGSLYCPHCSATSLLAANANSPVLVVRPPCVPTHPVCCLKALDDLKDTPQLLPGKSPGLVSTLSNAELKLKKDMLGLKRKLMDIGKAKDEL